jgi:hypothetical protein
LVNLKKANPWQAPPVTHYETVFTRREKINEEIKQGRVRIDFKTTDSLKKSGATYVKVSMDLNENIKLKSKFNIDKNN